MATTQEQKATPNILNNTTTTTSSWADPLRNRPSVATVISAVDSFSDPPPNTTSTTKGTYNNSFTLIYATPHIYWEIIR